MTRLMAFALVASLALLGMAPPSLAGSVYRSTGVADNAVAVGGATVYVHPADDTSDNWTGPALTDAFGRFTFPTLGPGKYLLRVYIGRQRAWQQVVTVTAPTVVPPIVLPANS